MAAPAPIPNETLLTAVESADNFDFHQHKNELTVFCLSNDTTSFAAPIGLLWPEVVEALREDNEDSLKEGKLPTWGFLPDDNTELNDLHPQRRISHAFFSSHIAPNSSARSEAIDATLTRWRQSGKFSNVIGGRLWRNELYPIYADPFRCLAHLQKGSVDGSADGVVFNVERAAAALFGVVTYGVHMTIFQRPAFGKEGEVMIWVATRSKTKQTWPGWLDNSVAGGIPSGMSPFESLVKESMEEASLAEDIVRKHTHSVGTVSYFFQKGRWLQPEVEFVYDLEIPSTLSEEESDAFQPKPLDGEVEKFEFLPLSEVVARIHKGLFKPNCAVVLVDFLIRHGFITPELEPNYLEINTRIHSTFEYTQWARIRGT